MRRTAETRFRGQAQQLGMFPDRRIVGRKIYAIDLVVGYVTMQPLDLRPQATQDLERL
jgi:hypothetical protein